MRHRLLFAISCLVGAAHWALMFSPIPWGPQAWDVTPLAPSHIDAIWVAPPTIEPPPPAPPSPPTPAPTPPSPRKRPAPTPAVEQSAPPPSVAAQEAPAELAAATDAPHEDMQAAAAPDIFENTTSTEDHASGQDSTAPAAPPAPKAGPQLQVQDASGAPVDVSLPEDGSALDQHMLLQFKVHGLVKGMEYHANAELEWQLQGQQYQARQSISAFLLGSMEQTSLGQLTAQGLQPISFSDRRFAKRRSVLFDWQAQQATFEPVRTAAPIGPGAQDRLSVFLQLAAMMQAMPALRSAGTRIDIPTMGSRRLQMWSFVVQTTETVDLPAGTLDTLRLQRLPQPGDGEMALLWLNPAQGYVPARIRMEEPNGDVMELSLK